MKHYLVNALFIISFIGGCVANEVNSGDVENHLNSIIDRKYDPLIGWGHGWNKINETNEKLELEFIKSKNCSYAITVNELSNTVESWRFTLPRSGCDGYYAPSL